MQAFAAAFVYIPFITDLCNYAKSTFKRNLMLLKKKDNEHTTSFKGHSSSVAINCHQMRCLRLLHPVPARLFNAASGAKNSAQPTNTHLPCQTQPTHTHTHTKAHSYSSIICQPLSSSLGITQPPPLLLTDTKPMGLPSNKSYIIRSHVRYRHSQPPFTFRKQIGWQALASLAFRRGRRGTSRYIVTDTYHRSSFG